MSWFLGGILFLIFGYFAYGKLVERLIPPTDAPTPAIAMPDGVDYVPMPKWKNMLIQLLNIAGIGPVIGVILGIQFGKVALLVIPVGCLLMGAVHDFVAAMISIRMKGANLPKIIRSCLGRGYASVFSWFLMVLLLLVVAVFINIPANLIDSQWFPGASVFWWAVAVIFVYYVVATLFPVDKIIGSVYPVFGALLVLGSGAIFAALVMQVLKRPELLADCPGFASYQAKNPLFPCLFVTIACGIISGFHATQSPIVARTIRSEREARVTFFGMMVVEGIIAMVWAAAALAIYNLDAGNLELPGPKVLGVITQHFLGPWMGGVTVLAVVILAVTSGDTALRSTRLTLAEHLSVSQVKISNRILTCLPLILIVAGLLWWSNISKETFGFLWRYFAWGNQVLAASTLMASTVWLLREGKGARSLMTLLPGMFMTSVVVSFIFWTSSDKGQPWGLVPGGLSLPWAVTAGVAVACAFAAYVFKCGKDKGDE